MKIEPTSFSQIPFEFGNFKKRDFASFVEGENQALIYSLNTIGHLISGNYEIGIELKSSNSDYLLCNITLDSLYQTQ